GLFFVFQAMYVVPAALRASSQLAFGLMIAYIAAGFVGQLPYGIMAAHGDFVLKNRIQLAGLLLRLALTYALLTMSATMVWLAVVQLTTLIVEFTIATLVIRRRY